MAQLGLLLASRSMDSPVLLLLIKSKANIHMQLIQMDFTLVENQKLIFDWMENHKIVAIFMAPPCGTCSLARNIPIPDDPSPPKPLRSLLEPDGLSTLSGRDRIRVSQANILYHFCKEVMDLACRLNIACMVENPRSSLFWFTTPWCDLSFPERLTYAYHQACAYGGSRPKWTCLCANFPEVALVSLICDNNHTHLPWGVQKTNGRRVFATALEVHYPSALCDAIVNAFSVHLNAKYTIIDNSHAPNAVFQAASGVQPLGNKLPPLFSPYSDVFVALTNKHEHVVWPPHCPSFQHAKLLHKIAVGSKGEAEIVKSGSSVNHRQAVFERVVSAVNSLKLNALINIDDMSDDVAFLMVYGFLLEPEKFVQKALACVHPFSPEVCLPSVLRDVVAKHCSMSHHEIALSRATFVRRWTERAIALEADEARLKASMDHSVAKATTCKRILLFREILEDLCYPDVGVVDELQHGVDLTGRVPVTGMLPGKFTPALLSDEALALRSSLTRTRDENSACSSGDAEIDAGVWSQTQEEVAAGWLNGPIPPGDVHPSEPISRRFGIRQGSKIRPIDDFSASGVNAAASACEAPMLHTVDVLAALLSEWFHKSAQSGVDSEVVARTYDLKSAYRQIGLSQQGRAKACISVYDPHAKLSRLFRLRVLPFGALRSVHSFLRLSRALWYVGVRGLHLLWTNFYDDFVVTSPPSLAASTSLAVEALFKLTGWAFAEDGKKCMPFSSSCQALGVLIDLSDSCKGRAFISNTRSRIDELSAALDDVINDGSIAQVEARRLKGRMQFAEAQLFGRVGKRCIRTLTDASEGRGKRLDDSDILFLELFSDFLKTGPPREISSSTSESLHIFTDACYGKDSDTWGCGIGGVAISSCGVWQHFSLPLNANLREVLGEGQKKQIIFEAETLGAVVALAVWKDQIKFKRCVLYVDNEGTKFSLIKGYADNPTVDKLAQVFAAVESEAHTYLWISRVASFSNVADEPSRGDCNRMLKFASNCVNSLASSAMDIVVSKAFEVEMGREAQASDVLRISHLKRKKCVHP